MNLLYSNKILSSTLEFFGVFVPGAVLLWALRIIAISNNLIKDTSWPDKTIEYFIFVVASFILGYLIYPPAHVLNKLYDAMYLKWKRKDGDPLLDYARERAAPYLNPKASVYAWAKSEVSAASPDHVIKIDRLEGGRPLARRRSRL